MNILYIVKSLSGGVAKHLYDLSYRYGKDGNDIHIVYDDSKSFYMDVAKFRDLKNVNLINEKIGDLISFQDFSLIKRLSKIIKDEYIDVIHGHSSKGGALARILARKMKRAVVYTPHCIYTLNPKLSKIKFFVYKNIEKILSKINKKSYIIAVSHSEKKHIKKKLRIKNKIELIHNSSNINVNKKANKKKDFTVVSLVARFAEQKNIETFIKAIALVDKKNPSHIFSILGYGENKHKIEKFAKNLGLFSKIMWLENEKLNGEDSARVSDICVIPSLYEVLPSYTMLEVLAYGRCLICADIDDARHILGEESIYGKPEDHIALSNKIQYFIDNSEERNLIANKNLKKYNEYKLDYMLKETYKIYEKLI